MMDLQDNKKYNLEDLIDIKEQLIEREEKVKSQTKILDIIFNSAPNILLLVNSEIKVEKINHRGIELAGREESDLIGLLGGEVFNCLNSFNGKGCGFNMECQNCPVRTKIDDTFLTGTPHHDEEAKMTFLVKGKKVALNLLLSTKLIELNNHKQVLVSLTNITKFKETEIDLRRSRDNLERLWNITKLAKASINTICDHCHN